MPKHILMAVDLEQQGVGAYLNQDRLIEVAEMRDVPVLPGISHEVCD